MKPYRRCFWGVAQSLPPKTRCETMRAPHISQAARSYEISRGPSAVGNGSARYEP